MTNTSKANQSEIYRALKDRFGDAPEEVGIEQGTALLRSMALRGSCRSFVQKPVPDTWIDLLCAIALSSPTKSDLQQRDIVILRADDQRQKLAALVSGQEWVADAPMLAVFCGNNRRQRLVHEWRGIPFANDHLDAFFNAVGDAAIALASFVTAAEAIGLGCCPISAVRNEARAVSTLLDLPDHVFPFAGLAFGFPAAEPKVSKRLPLRVTCHTDRYSESDLAHEIDRYDKTRAAAQPYAGQRFPEVFLPSDAYGWSEDKARQYSQPERSDFGAFVREKGFRLD